MDSDRLSVILTMELPSSVGDNTIPTVTKVKKIDENRLQPILYDLETLKPSTAQNITTLKNAMT